MPGVRVTVVDNASPDDSLGADRGPAVDDRPLAPQRRVLLRLQPRRRRAATPRSCSSSTRTPASTRRRWPRCGRPSTAHPARRARRPAARSTRTATLAWSLRRFPRQRSTFAQALFLHRLWPRAPWTDELVRDPAAYERAGHAGLGLRRLHARPPRRVRGDRRVRRGLLPLLRGHRPVPPPLGRRARGALRARGGGAPRGRRLVGRRATPRRSPPAAACSTRASTSARRRARVAGARRGARGGHPRGGGAPPPRLAPRPPGGAPRRLALRPRP